MIFFAVSCGLSILDERMNEGFDEERRIREGSRCILHGSNLVFAWKEFSRLA